MVQELSLPRRHGPEPMDDPDLEARATALLDEPAVAAAARHLRDGDERTLRDQMELTRIPAPPFGEEPRGRRMAELMVEAGLEEVGPDREGNVLGRLGSGGEHPLVLSAHLDTVFPAGTDVTVTRSGNRITGPGISDDGRGLAALLALARTLAVTGLDPGAPLLFAATVGEEGAGDLRGVRHLFRKDGPGRDARGFVSLDGAGVTRIVNAGLGSKRYRVTARGAGGHSWVSWGTPNPIHALGRLVSDLTRLELPGPPRTTLTVARWAGGTSVNAIPQEAWVELEVRSEDTGPLASLDREVRRRAEVAVAAVNAAGTPGASPLRLTTEAIGDRPAGGTPTDALLVRAAVAATRALGTTPELAVSSTDANIPMTLGIPAVTMGAGGEAGNAHTTQEWYRNVGGPEGILRALLTVLLIGRAESDPGA